MNRADVIIVGAGPGGSSAAYFLARAGIRTLLLDKKDFPRDKPCGDAISRGALRQLVRLGLKEWIDERQFLAPTGVRVGSPNGQIVALKLPQQPDDPYGMLRMIPRRKLDTALLEVALAAGAEFKGGVNALGMAADRSGATVHVVLNGKRETLQCRTVVAADGAGGLFSRSTGLKKGTLLLVTARAYVECMDDSAEFVDMLYESDTVPGYGWIFPVEDNLCNVGIGIPVRQARGVRIQDRLRWFMDTNLHATRRLKQYTLVSRPQVAPLFSGFEPKHTFGDRLLAVGDAAGLVNPLTGSGISKALESGEMAAQCIQEAFFQGDCAASSLALYGRRLSEKYSSPYRALNSLRRLASSSKIMNRIVHDLNQDNDFHQLVQEAFMNRVPFTTLLLALVDQAIGWDSLLYNLAIELKRFSKEAL